MPSSETLLDRTPLWIRCEKHSKESSKCMQKLRLLAAARVLARHRNSISLPQLSRSSTNKVLDKHRQGSPKKETRKKKEDHAEGCLLLLVHSRLERELKDKEAGCCEIDGREREGERANGRARRALLFFGK